MLLGQGVVIFGEDPRVQTSRKLLDPTVVESMEAPRVHPGPVVNGHGLSSPRSSVAVNYSRSGADFANGLAPFTSLAVRLRPLPTCLSPHQIHDDFVRQFFHVARRVLGV